MTDDAKLKQAAHDASHQYAEEWTQTHSVREVDYGQKRQEIRNAFEAGYRLAHFEALATRAGTAAGAAAASQKRAPRKGSTPRPKAAG